MYREEKISRKDAKPQGKRINSLCALATLRERVSHYPKFRHYRRSLQFPVSSVQQRNKRLRGKKISVSNAVLPPLRDTRASPRGCAAPHLNFPL